MHDKQSAPPNVGGNPFTYALKEKFMRRERTRFFVSMAVVSFVLHSIWEMSQMAAYKDLSGS